MPTPQPSRLLLVKSPFLLIRFVIFSLLIYLGLTALGFAAWEVGANRAAGAHVNGAPALLIFTGITIPLCIAASLADLKLSSLMASMVGIECLWTGIFSSLQIAASIFITLAGPPESCEARAPLTFCASTTILVPISWMAATLLLGYFIGLVTLCTAHMHLYPTLWSMPLYEIDWFIDGDARDKRSSVPQLPPLNTSTLTRLSVTSRRHSISSFPKDVENQVPVSIADRERSSASSGTSNAWWGRLLPGRAGKDHPYRIRRVKGPEFQWQGNEGDLGYGQHPPASQVLSPGVTRTQPYPSVATLNEDEPIPLGDRSQWVRAVTAPMPYNPRLRSNG
ncbi:hypothetical protein EI94DRAFT_14876 [Lactarius quietus]|nr:hypothetical protein EI94DRAFT_14876 [Lactarius quietus]